MRAHACIAVGASARAANEMITSYSACMDEILRCTCATTGANYMNKCIYVWMPRLYEVSADGIFLRNYFARSCYDVSLI